MAVSDYDADATELLETYGECRINTGRRAC